MLREDAPHPHGPQPASLPGGPAELLGLGLEPPDDYGRPLRPVRGWAYALIAAGALIAGFLFTSGLVAGHETARAQDLRRDELVDLIGEREAQAEALSSRRDELRAEIAEAERAAIDRVPAMHGLLEDLEVLAGAAPVQGPGVRMTLTDAEECVDQAPENCRILDSDLQVAVNTLFGAGAEAVAVNGERVVATTALRNAGSTITVNYRVQTSPYRIEAVGDSAALRRAVAESDFGRNFEDWSESFGLGFEIEPDDSLELPAYRGSLTLRTARVSEGHSP